ncbi:MAG: FecR family protein [Gallionellaceae bacterium]
MNKINSISHLIRYPASFLNSAYFVAVLVFALFTISVPPAQAAQERAGVILALTGNVEIFHGQKKHPAVNHADLYSGDTIVTGVGQIQIRFADGTLLTLYRDTKFSVDDYHYGNGRADRASFSLTGGLMHTLTGKIDKSKYLLKTRLANLAVRGTEYSVQLGDVLHVSVDHGRVQLLNAGGDVLVGAGQSIFITGANAMPQPVLGGKVNLGMHPSGGGGHGAGGAKGSRAQGGPRAQGAQGGAGGLGGAGGGGAAPPPPPPGVQKF